MPTHEDDTCACGCGATLAASPSEYFATEGCQRRWAAARTHQGVLDRIDAAVEQARAQTVPIAADTARQTFRQAAAEYRAVLRAQFAAATLDTAAQDAGVTWTDIGTTTEAITYTTPPARWWSYNRAHMVWTLREHVGLSTRDLFRVTEEAAAHVDPTLIIDYLRRRVGGHIPPIPNAWLQ